MKIVTNMECKRIFKNKTSMLSLLSLCIWMVVVITSSIFQESVIYDMNTKRVNGLNAIQLEKENFVSYVFEDDIRNIVSPYQAYGGKGIHEEEANQIVYAKELFSTQQLASFVNKVYAPMDDALTNTAIFEIKDTRNFYQEWQKKVAIYHQEMDASHTISLENLDEFSYSYSKGWENVFKKIPEMLLGILICLSLCLASVFSENYELHTSEYMQITKKGKSATIWAKIIASFVFSTLVYWIFLIMFSSIMFCIFGFEGSTTSVQVLLHTFYPQNMNMMDAVLKLATLGYATVVSMVAIFIFSSSLFQSSFKTSIIAMLMVFIPYYASSLNAPSFALRFLPMNFINEINIFHMDSIHLLGKAIQLPTMFIYESLGIIFLCCIAIFLRESFQRK